MNLSIRCKVIFVRDNEMKQKKDILRLEWQYL
jgi:hypothetical protein